MMHLHFVLVEARERATSFAFYTWFKQSMPSSHSLMSLAIYIALPTHPTCIILQTLYVGRKVKVRSLKYFISYSY